MSTISIVIPCYNVEDKIIRCLQSIKEQSFDDFTCYIIDDGSSDKTASIIKSFINEDNRFLYFYKDNGGQASARNLGIELTKEPYITFIDSDDYVHQDYLLQLFTPFKTNDIDMTACYFERVYENKVSVNNFTKQDLLLSKFPAVWGKLFKTEIIKNNNIEFPKGLWYEDLYFFAEVISHVNNIQIVDHSLYYYIQNKNSTMYTYSDKIFDIYSIFNKFKNENHIKKDVLEYLMIYHILVGTVFRASFKEDFSTGTIKEIVSYVEKDNPRWFKNQFIKSQLSFFYKAYLWFLKTHQYGIVYIVLKIMNRHISL